MGLELPGEFGHGFKGILDDIRIYNRALGAQEILELFNIETALVDDAVLPDKMHLYQNYPNPFNPETNIKFALKKQSFVKLEIYDINGKRVANLFNGPKEIGIHIFKWNANSFASGIYFIRMSAERKSFVRKIVKLK